MRWLPLLLLVVLCSCSYKVDRSALYIPMGNNIGVATSIRVNVKPASEMKFTKVVRQKLDYSCGSAAIATVFNYYLNVPVREEQVTREMFEAGNKEKIIKRKGFSLLDMKRYAERRGFKAYGIRTTVKGLAKLGKPAIVTIVIGNYKHFVVFRGVYKGRVFIADPAFGNTIMTPEKFEEVWYKKIALIIEPKEENFENGLKVTEKDMRTINAGALRGELVFPILPVYTYSTDF